MLYITISLTPNRSTYKPHSPKDTVLLLALTFLSARRAISLYTYSLPPFRPKLFASSLALAPSDCTACTFRSLRAVPVLYSSSLAVMHLSPSCIFSSRIEMRIEKRAEHVGTSMQ